MVYDFINDKLMQQVYKNYMSYRCMCLREDTNFYQRYALNYFKKHRMNQFLFKKKF